MGRVLILTTMIVSVILIPLNLLGGIISGLWLAILGEWSVIAVGIALSIFGPLILSIPIMLNVPVAALGIKLFDKKNKILAQPVLFLSVLLTHIIIYAWCVGVFYYFLDSKTHDNIVPLMIWSYGTAIAPWMYMAKKERNEYASITVFLIQIGLLLTMALYGFFDVPFMQSCIALAVILAIGATLQFLHSMTHTKTGSI